MFYILWFTLFAIWFHFGDLLPNIIENWQCEALMSVLLCRQFDKLMSVLLCRQFAYSLLYHPDLTLRLICMMTVINLYFLYFGIKDIMELHVLVF
jgi:hypothetical protein